MLALEIQENLNRITPDVVDRPTPRKVLDNDEELARQIQMEGKVVLYDEADIYIYWHYYNN